MDLLIMEINDLTKVVTYLSLFGAIYSALLVLLNDNTKFFDANKEILNNKVKDVDLKGRKDKIEKMWNSFIFINKCNSAIKWISILFFNFLIFTIAIKPGILNKWGNNGVWFVIISGLVVNVLTLFCVCSLRHLCKKITDEHFDYLKDTLP